MDIPNQFVTHCRRHFYHVYIGRPSKWGNPFMIGRDGNRAEVLQKYRDWIRAPGQEWLRDAARKELRGKILGCWCSPKTCHGDVLAEIANG